MITPAISVLSAIEGLNLVTPALDRFIVPISLAIIVGLFAVQSRGTASVAAWFGPITAIWFVALALGGLVHIVERPDILAAVNPVSGVRFLTQHGMAGLLALGAVFLAVTGAEALYADLGHFGRGPIRTAWLGFVFPSLVLNYIGQGAMLLGNPQAMENPFFRLYPEWALLPMVCLATLATIIASQAVITGAFSMTQQAVQFGLLPRFDIRPTSETEKGQIYIPSVNWLLMLAVLFLVQAFRSSSALAAAYGIAVTGTMVVTAILAFVVAWRCWKWPFGAQPCSWRHSLQSILSFSPPMRLRSSRAAGCPSWWAAYCWSSCSHGDAARICWPRGRGASRCRCRLRTLDRETRAGAGIGNSRVSDQSSGDRANRTSA